MKPVTVGRYSRDLESPEPPDRHNPWLGWVETEDWIIWEHESGTLHVANGRGELGNPYPGAMVIVSRSVEQYEPILPYTPDSPVE